MEASNGQRLIPVSILSQRGNQTKGEVRIRDWSRPERMKNALRYLGFCWGGALVAVLIPFLHFILVPSLLIAGPIVASMTFKRESSRLGGSGTCPECKAELPLAAGAVRWPFSDLCTKCQAGVNVEPRSGESVPGMADSHGT